MTEINHGQIAFMGIMVLWAMIPVAIILIGTVDVMVAKYIQAKNAFIGRIMKTIHDQTFEDVTHKIIGE